MKKGLLIQLATAVLLVLITASNGYFYFLVFSQPKAQTPGSALMDSIRIIQQKRAQFQDSLIILEKQHETLTIKKDSVLRLDSLQWAGLRDSMRTSVRSRVAAKLRERAAR